MKKILIIGAGRSSTGLINHLNSESKSQDYTITVADYTLENATKRTLGLPLFKATQLDVRKDEQLKKIIAEHDIVASLVPAHLHFPIALQCIQLKKNLVTASYTSPEIEALHSQAKEAGALILMEMGLDPGIDHMSAKQEIDKIQDQGGHITSFKSFTGGLISPESDDNPWNYKFTWNPRNVVLAGQGAVKFLRDGKTNYIPYHNLCKNIEPVNVKNLGEFEAYANRDSLKYKELYNLDNINTIFRGTLRKRGFCEAWNTLVQLGFTDDSYEVEGIKGVSFHDFLKAYLPKLGTKTIEETLCSFLKIAPSSSIFEKLDWLGLFSSAKINLDTGSPAKILQSMLEKKWKLSPNDKDMIVMQHQFEYELNNAKHKDTYSLIIKGDNAENTSMSKTVGLPMGIAISNLLKGNWNQLTGIVIPTNPIIYTSVLDELKNLEVSFEKE